MHLPARVAELDAGGSHNIQIPSLDKRTVSLGYFFFIQAYNALQDSELLTTMCQIKQVRGLSLLLTLRSADAKPQSPHLVSFHLVWVSEIHTMSTAWPLC